MMTADAGMMRIAAISLVILSLIGTAIFLVASPGHSVTQFCMDFDWGEGGPNGFAKPGLRAEESPQDHVAWYEGLGANVIQLGAKNRIAIELTSKHKIPSIGFVKLAGEPGCRLCLGSNRHDDEPEKLDASIRMFKECGLTPLNLYLPTEKILSGQFSKNLKTEVSIRGDKFFINGKASYAGRTWKGHKIEGLLMNSRMVQGLFDDLNPETLSQWAYPDTGRWDPERNVDEFLAAMPIWRQHGLLAVTVNFQGGSPQGYSQEQPWHNSAFEPDGKMRPAYMDRMKKLLDKADDLGMVVIVGFFYFGQDHRLSNEAAVINATDNATKWLAEGGWRNVLVEIDNECDVRYQHSILKPQRVHELIERVQNYPIQRRRLLVSVSYGGNSLPGEKVVEKADFILMHGNGVSDPRRIGEMVRQTRGMAGYTPKPILFNEDDHFDFDQPLNNFVAAVSEYASWGYFDYRMKGEGFNEGYQSVPVNWGISSSRKRGFFTLLAEITDSQSIKSE